MAIELDDSIALIDVFARNLRAILAARNMSRAALARAAGVPQTTINLYCNGAKGRAAELTSTGKRSGPTFQHLDKISRALNVPTWQLLCPIIPKEMQALDSIRLLMSN